MEEWKSVDTVALDHAWKNAKHNFDQRSAYYDQYIKIITALFAGQALLITGKYPSYICVFNCVSILLVAQALRTLKSIEKNSLTAAESKRPK